VVLAQGQPDTAQRAATRAADRSVIRGGDYIVAIVNQELVTAVEVSLRAQRARDEANRQKVALPEEQELRRQITQALIEERVILTHAREGGVRIDDAELDRTLQGIAAQNQLSVDGLRERLRGEGTDFDRFRVNLREQLMVERARERDVLPRIRITEAEVDNYLMQQARALQADRGVNLAQILVNVPEGASSSEVQARRARAEAALERLRAGATFEQVALEVSDDGNRQRGGEMGMRPASRYPDLFIDNTRQLQPGQFTTTLVRSGAGFHILKVIARAEGASNQVTQTRVRHILLRPSQRLSLDQAKSRIDGYRRSIQSRSATFEELARQFSEDGSAAQGGDLGWASPGTMVPEFEEAMNQLEVGGLSAPVTSRFGVHLVQVLERRQVDVDPKQLREQARNALREQKFDPAYAEWVRDLRSRAYIEMREPPL
jgi:peptidyl-prolyl cis-trans isomerase SurA